MVSSLGHRIGWSCLLLGIFYTLGVIVFVRFERPAELERTAQNRRLYEEMQALYSFHHCEDPAFQQLSFCEKQAEFSVTLKAYFNQHGNSMEDRQQWTFIGTVFFLTHLATTIGYGSSYPQTPEGQFATIFFALGGIPVMGYTLMQVARLNVRVSLLLLRKAGAVEKVGYREQIGVLWGLLLVLLFGGAAVYAWLEPWTYLQCIYFCFVTLSTVGFGDFLPSTAGSQAFSIFYMIFGLGVCASIIALLTGLVAEGHATMDSLVSATCQENWKTCCICCDKDKEEQQEPSTA
eukprot:TRINITY_DN15973_c0_g1_i1.p1 TRINITY_DN15973_c0_g1~~TRINITY_DN15973_c0_g1_i1.p1  ORF type:complete len:291 (-),score=75.34 TRINITY_DN15973_c0_g1_i1:250-1122(-)